MSDPIEQGRLVFIEEAQEKLAELEAAMLELEDDPTSSELIAQAFRSMHTIKGSGAMFGFDKIAAFTHEIETVYDLIRNGELPLTPQIISLTLSAHDQIKKMLFDEESKDPERRKISKAFRELLPEKPVAQSPSTKPSTESKTVADDSSYCTYRISFTPPQEIFLQGMNPAHLIEELAELGDLHPLAHLSRIPALPELNPEECWVTWDFLLFTDRDENEIRDVFIFVEEESKLEIHAIASENELLDDEIDRRLGEIFIDRKMLQAHEVHQALQTQLPIGKILEQSGLATKDQVASALMEQKTIRNLRESIQQKESSSSIRVPSDKLDKLVDLVGELVTSQARLTQIATQRQDPDLQSIAEEIERLTADLRDNTMGIHMLKIGSVFNKYRRLVRDLSQNLGQEVIMTTAGGETELDKTILEQLDDPLVHIIRNAVDHGIESPKQREQRGKPIKGTVQLSAIHSGDSVLIKISDDGAGINPQKIVKKAVEKGLISPDSELTEKETFNLLFAPGFSTAEKVTNISGRGVGMDVVKKKIESLRGSVQIESKFGEGTTITLKLPLTMAIIDGLLVQVVDEFYVIPLLSVEECVELTGADYERAHHRNIAFVRDQMIPLIRLREQFHFRGERPEIEQIVITHVEGSRVGFVVDKVVGEHQTVIKSLGRIYRHIHSVSGATIMADGAVALILDLNKLTRQAESMEQESTRRKKKGQYGYADSTEAI